MIKKKGILILTGWLTLWLPLCLTGCSPGTQQQNTSSESNMQKDRESLTVVGVSQVGSESVWRTANTASIQKVFTQENGYFLIFDNARQKQENQIKAIRSFISQQVDYIVFSPIMEDGWETVLQEAKDAGIPVVLMDRQLNVEDESLYVTWIGSDFEKEGHDAGEWLSAALAKQGREQEEINIVVLQGTKGSSSETGRTNGFNDVVREHPNWNVLCQTDAEYTTAKGQEEMEKLLARYDDIDVVVSQNDDMTFGALEAIRLAGRTTGTDGDIIMISFDAVRSALEMVKDGVISVDVECNPLQGDYIEEVIRRLNAGETVEKAYYVPEEVFTQENVENFLTDRTY